MDKPHRYDLPEAEAYNHKADSENVVHGIPLYQGEENKPELKRFVVQGYKDLWAAILFILVFLATLGIVGYRASSSDPKEPPQVNDTNVTATPSVHDPAGGTKGRGKVRTAVNVLTMVCISAAVSVLAASLCLFLMRSSPRKVIYGANVATIVLNVCAAVMTLFINVAVAILLLILCGVHALWFYFARARIPFSAELLKASIEVTSTYNAVHLINLSLTVTAAAYVALWTYAVAKFTHDESDINKWAPIIVTFLLLSLFWTQQVLGNLMHVTTAGLTATWYFAGKNNMPRNPTLASFKRGATTSFGSICFGSLLVAIIRVIRVIVSSAENSNHEVLRCIFLCIINCLENLLEYFNTYAFVHVAIYGCGYIEAAKKTWELCKQCCFAALFNDALIHITLSLLALASSLLVSAIIGFLYFSYVAFAAAFLVSILVHSLLFAPITSGVTTFFVCYAEVPEGLQHSAPELYAAIHSADQNGTGNNAQAPRV